MNLKEYINFFCWWMLSTYYLSRGDIFGVLLSIAGFLFMMHMLENDER